jgi:O-antigen ligase
MSKKPIFPYYIYVTIVANATLIILSPRDFISNGESFASSYEQGFVSVWLIRFASFFAIITTIDVVLRKIKKENKFQAEVKIILFSFVLFWLTNVGFTSLLAGHKYINFQLLYGLFIGVGAILCGEDLVDDIIRITRNSLVIFTIVGLLFILIKRDLVLDFSYGQGLISGLPRFAGIAPHAITNAVLISTALFCIKLKPYNNTTTNNLVTLTCMGALFLTQAKATIISFLISYMFLCYFTKPVEIKRNIGTTNNAIKKSLGRLLLISFIFAASVFISGKMSSLLSSTDSAQLTSFTGRDVIWEIAINEWRKYPIFGYGLQLFGVEHRIEIGKYYATGGHNQIIDTLARAGISGLCGFLFFILISTYYAFKKKMQTFGLPLSILIFSFLRFTTEVPFFISTIGPETLMLILLLSSLSSSKIKFNNE